MAFTQGILDNVQLSGEQSTVLYPYLREVYINECPLVTRLPRLPSEGAVFSIVSYDIRPRSYTLAAAFTASGADLDITLVDASPLLVGDVLEVKDTAGTATERVEIVSMTSATVFNVRRAREGTSVIANTAGGSADSLIVTLIGNSRTGSEYDQEAARAIRTAIEQYIQTFQIPVQVGGLANAVRNTHLPAGFSDVFSMEQKIALNTMMVDEEYTSYYGIGEKAVAQGDRAKQKGARTLIATFNGGSNLVTSPLNAAAYKPEDLVRDTIQKIIDAGGDPDAMLCSTDFLGGLMTWGFPAMNVTPRESALGVAIKEIVVPFASGPITLIPSPKLKRGSAIVLTSSDACIREVRAEQFKPRGSRGDVNEGDALSSIALELGHAGWHAMVENITAYSAA